MDYASEATLDTLKKTKQLTYQKTDENCPFTEENDGLPPLKLQRLFESDKFVARNSLDLGTLAPPKEKTALFRWLAANRLPQLYDVLYENGFDDISMLLQQVRASPLTSELLERIGVRKPGHRARLLALLTREAQPFQAESLVGCCSKPKVSASCILHTDLQQWLVSLRLDRYFGAFVDTGYDDLEQLVLLATIPGALTEDVLTGCLGIHKPSHRQRLLASLRHEVTLRGLRVDSDSADSLLAMCLLM